MRMLLLGKVSCLADFSYQSRDLFHQYVLKIVRTILGVGIYRVFFFFSFFVVAWSFLQ